MSLTKNLEFEKTSFLNKSNSAFIEQMYLKYVNNDNDLPKSWKKYFDGLGDELNLIVDEIKGPSWSRNRSDQDFKEIKTLNDKEKNLDKKDQRIVHSSDQLQNNIDSIKAVELIRAYRLRGHLLAKLDPLGLKKTEYLEELHPEYYGFKKEDYSRNIFLNGVTNKKNSNISEILKFLNKTYCGNIGYEYMHLSNPTERIWLRKRIEEEDDPIKFTKNGKEAILNKLIQAEGFEKFLAKKYVGTKRFGLDGAETLIPALEQIIKRGGALGVKEIVIGMPHRGRLSVLANVMGKPYKAIFNEFQGGSFKPEDVDGSGDVKYHLGASSDREFDGNKVHLSLTANPSHLEAVNPVVIGKVRAKQQQLNDKNRTAVLPLLLHGDAAFAGQGVVAECFGLSGLVGHKTGGTIHVVVNNQIGFTTAPHFSRSSPYPTDIALMVEAPIFHVNGDDPEAVVHAAKVATEFRQKFQKDVVIDIICYRRFGHNEGDEPMFTNPIMYKKIKTQRTTLTLYTDRLVKDGLIPEGEIEDLKTGFQSFLNEEFEAGKNYKPNKADWLDGRWAHLDRNKDDYQRGQTAISDATFEKVGNALSNLPDNFPAHKTVVRLLENKKKMFSDGTGLDWATAEALAFGSLLNEGFPVRLSGQDATRGTFSQRHSGIINQNNEDRFYPLNNIAEGQAQYEVIDSMLSEYAVLGFEYGYSLSEPNALVAWEAQFGDFANGAQIMFDQFISSGESKWLRMSGLVVLLPHGFEGQGPEHSSARLERFLQMCGQDNWIVANCSTPANYFHILRRQLHRSFRKPLILLTPKSLLRHKLCVSDKSDFTDGSSFHRVLWDDAERGSSKTKLLTDKKIKRVVMCSGKVYYDLLEERDRRGISDIYILRFEQFYPFPAISAVKELERFKNAEMVWCQEEPKNQGGWSFMEPNLEWVLSRINAAATRPHYIGRASSASPATGLASTHKNQQEALINEALSFEGN